MPQDLNGPERAFADLLDADTTGTVDYWFRNEPRKPWSIGIVMPSGDRYFPDFAVKVAGPAGRWPAPGGNQGQAHPQRR
jgi:type III restriction enzyme